jgi:hypothetical protein
MTDFQKMKGYREMEDTGPEVFEQYQIASFQKLAFPVISIDESGGNRLARRQRPYRNGAKLDDIGSKEKVWTMEAMFSNRITEPGLEVNGGRALYPDILNELLAMIDLYHDEAGDLVVPTRGPVRARLDDYKRVENADGRDSALLTLVFVQDNEDNVNAASFNLPSVKANSQKVSDDVEESAQEEGAWDTSFQDLAEYAGQLEGLINAPSEYKADYESRAKLVMASVDRVFTAFTQHGVPGRDLLLKPEMEATQRLLTQLKDMVGRETIEARRGRPQLTSVAFSTQRTLMSIAAQYNQPYDDLLEVNSQLENPMAIEPGDVVRIFVNGAPSR